MREAATDLDFEEAARLRDEIKRLRATELAVVDDPTAKHLSSPSPRLRGEGTSRRPPSGGGPSPRPQAGARRDGHRALPRDPPASPRPQGRRARRPAQADAGRDGPGARIQALPRPALHQRPRRHARRLQNGGGGDSAIRTALGARSSCERPHRKCIARKRGCIENTIRKQWTAVASPRKPCGRRRARGWPVTTAVAILRQPGSPAIAWARQNGVKPAANHLLDQLANAVTDTGFDWIKPIVEKMGVTLGRRMQSSGVVVTVFMAWSPAWRSNAK